ncbi:MAG: ABC transporter substrate-binding protein [Chloroflexi bacterium]|nr:ABC transporter substrate-binding protein [Chloroflexota bacterium]MBV9601417.1 ABC transporter substrate-binding protein [Chloroflexota bacterium]
MPKDSATTRISRRTALTLITSGLGTVALAACAPTAPSAPAASVSTPGAPAGGQPAAATTSAGADSTPKSGGTLRYGATDDVNRLDPHFRLGDVYYTVYDRLTQFDLNHNPQPMLAESWDVSSDFTTIQFHLRKGVQFHNGAELDSTAVKFNSERARDLPNTQLDEAKWWTSIETPDKYTVIFKSDKPRPTAFDFFEFLNIAEPTAANDPTKAVGTGPFKFVEWRQNEALVLTKNSNYWETGKPYLDGINMSIITDPQAMTTQFEAGALDVAIPPVTDFIRLRDDPKYTPITYSAGNFSCLGIQCQQPPFDNKQARQALQFAVDRMRWANTIQKGLETPSALPWARTSPAYDETKGNAYQFDLDKAKSMLQAAGVTGPLSGDVIMPNSMAELTQFAQILQSDFATLGITLTLKPQDTASYLDLVNNWKYKGFWLGGGSFAQLDPATGFVKSRALSVTGNSSAFTTPANAAAVDLVGRATSEADPEKRKQLYSDLNDMLLQEAYIITMSPTTNRFLTTTKVKNVVSTLHSAQKWWEAWLS